jgi:hypothetical protein
VATKNIHSELCKVGLFFEKKEEAEVTIF